MIYLKKLKMQWIKFCKFWVISIIFNIKFLMASPVILNNVFSSPTNSQKKTFIEKVFSYLSFKDIFSLTETNHMCYEIGQIPINRIYKVLAKKVDFHLDDVTLCKAFVRDYYKISFYIIYEKNSSTSVVALNNDNQTVYGEMKKRNDELQNFSWSPSSKFRYHSDIMSFTSDYKVGVQNYNDKPTAYVLIDDETFFLGQLNDGTQSSAIVASSDCNVVLGRAADGHDDNKMKFFRWTKDTGMQPLGQLLGQSLPKDFIIDSVVAISSNGFIMIGNGSYGNDICGWYAVIPRKELLPSNLEIFD